MQLIISIFLAIMPVHAQDDTGAAACDDWGTIEQSESVIENVRAGDPQIQFTVAGSPDCGNEDECQWEFVGGNDNQRPGSLYLCDEAPDGALTESGGSVCYMPPDSLYQCNAFPFQVKLTCTDGDGNELEPDYREGELKDLSLDCTVDASVTGGGCISAQGSGVVTASVWLLFPFFGIGAWARRRDD